jgi:predicted phosphodiesterase
MMLKKIQYISDIHLEFYKNIQSVPEIPVNADILVLAGDIGYPTLPIYWDFLEKQSLHFNHIILITGNHEYYHTNNAIKMGRILTINQIDELIHSEIKRRKLDNIHFLQCNSIIIDDMEFIGATAWTDIPENKINNVVTIMNDYSRIFIDDNNTNSINKVTVEELNKIHREHTNFIYNKCTKNSKIGIKKIVITHHMPSTKMINIKYINDDINCAFTSDILHTIPTKPDVWICGHSHSVYDDIVDDVHCVMNPIGYPNENKELNWGKCINIT